MKRDKVSYTQIIRAAFFVTALFFLFTCSKKAAQPSAAAAGSVNAQNSAADDSLAEAFSEAGLAFVREKIPFPDFTLPALTGDSQSLGDLKGKVVFLNFWATWCGPCRLEMPSMETLYNSYRERGLEILAVNCGERQSEVLTFMNENKLSFPVVLDSDGKVSITYGVQALPTSYLIDREGMIKSLVVGSINWDTPEIRAVLEMLLN